MGILLNIARDQNDQPASAETFQILNSERPIREGQMNKKTTKKLIKEQCMNMDTTGAGRFGEQSEVTSPKHYSPARLTISAVKE